MYAHLKLIHEYIMSLYPSKQKIRFLYLFSISLAFNCLSTLILKTVISRIVSVLLSLAFTLFPFPFQVFYSKKP